MLSIGDIVEAAVWFDPLEKGSRDFALSQAKTAFEKYAATYNVTLSPVEFRDMRHGEPRVPSPPKKGAVLLYGSAKVTAFGSGITIAGARFVNDLGHDDLMRLRKITRQQWALAYAKDPKPGLKPWLSDAECDHLIDEMGPNTALKVLRQKLN